MNSTAGPHSGFLRGARDSRCRYMLLAGLLVLALALTAIKIWQSFAPEPHPFSAGIPAAYLVLLTWNLARYWDFLGQAPADEATRCRQVRQFAIALGAIALLSAVGTAVLDVRLAFLFHGMTPIVGPKPLPPAAAAATAALRRQEWLIVATGAAESVFLLLFALSQVWLWRHASRKLRRLSGHCEKCGYPLTGLPEPRCPECGTPINAH